jgi:hypothetical protein
MKVLRALLIKGVVMPFVTEDGLEPANLHLRQAMETCFKLDEHKNKKEHMEQFSHLLTIWLKNTKEPFSYEVLAKVRFHPSAAALLSESHCSTDSPQHPLFIEIKNDPQGPDDDSEQSDVAFLEEALKKTLPRLVPHKPVAAKADGKNLRGGRARVPPQPKPEKRGSQFRFPNPAKIAVDEAEQDFIRDRIINFFFGTDRFPLKLFEAISPVVPQRYHLAPEMLIAEACHQPISSNSLPSVPVSNLLGTIRR